MKFGICDDNRQDLLALKGLLLALRGDCQVAAFPEWTGLLEALKAGERFDCLFLDILMPGRSGMQLISQIRSDFPEERFPVVFTTSSRDYAVEAFAKNALHYLVKPITREDVGEALGRLPAQARKRTIITLKTKGGRRSVYREEISLCQSEAHAVLIRLSSGESFLCFQPLKNLEEQLGEDFLLLSRGLIVNVRYIQEMGSQSCLLLDGRTVLLSRKNRKQLRSSYECYLFSSLLDE